MRLLRDFDTNMINVTKCCAVVVWKRANNWLCFGGSRLGEAKRQAAFFGRELGSQDQRPMIDALLKVFAG